MAATGPRIAFCARCGTRLPAAPPVRCAGCGADVFADARPCAGALVEDGGRLLLVRRAHEPFRGAWDVPGGHCLAGEHPSETAVREAFEETGVPIRVTGLFGVWLEPGDPSDPGDAGTLNVYYLAAPTGGAPGTPDPAESTEVRWFLPDEIPDDVAFPAHVPAVFAAWRAR